MRRSDELDPRRKGRTRCPVCGRGTLRDLAFDAGTGQRDGPPKQVSDSSEVDVYTCGHEVTRESLARADRSLDVERRQSQDSLPPPLEGLA